MLATAVGLEDIGGFPGSLFGTMATSISGNEITGVATTSEGAYHAFRWTSGAMQDLGTAPNTSAHTHSTRAPLPPYIHRPR